MRGALARRGIIGRPATATTTNIFTQFLTPSSTFSTSSNGGGRGRGRGSSSTPPTTPFSAQTPGKPTEEDPQIYSNAPSSIPSGFGHGRGKIPISPNPVAPSFSPRMPGINPSVGRGRTNQEVPIPPQRESQSGVPKKPMFFTREGDFEQPQKLQFDEIVVEERGIPASILSGLPGAGRGKPGKFAKKVIESEENRHARQPRLDSRRGGTTKRGEDGPRMSREDAVKKAMGILSRGGDAGMEGRGRSGFRGRGMRGGFNGGRGGRGGRRGRGRGRFDDDNDDEGFDISLGDDADGERLAKKLGPEMMDKLTEAFDEMADRVLPSPVHDEYVDALYTNYLIECEPEYLMGDFDRNPDIDDTPPMPLRDYLEKQKPFLMAYEGIQSQEEWEQIIEELMERVPLMKEIIDEISGPDRVTAKQQQHELERVAKTLPDNVPSSVKQFTDRAVLSLQSNPGWGFDKKCQFMDKLVREVQQQYK